MSDYALGFTGVPGTRHGSGRARVGRVHALLKEAEAELTDIYNITIYTTDGPYREPVYDAISRWLKDLYRVSTGLIVNGLARPEMLMEIDVDRITDEERTTNRGVG